MGGAQPKGTTRINSLEAKAAASVGRDALLPLHYANHLLGYTCTQEYRTPISFNHFYSGFIFTKSALSITVNQA